MKKILVIIPVIIIILILVIGFSLNSIIKGGVETIGSKATGADVRLSDVDVSLFSGKGQIRGLFVGNPSGFEADSAFKLNEIRLALDIMSIFSDKVIIDKIIIDAPEITYEKGGQADNIRTILDNIKAFAGEGEKTAGQEKTGKKGKEKKVQINSFVLKNGSVNVTFTGLGEKPLSMKLPDIHMKDIGREGSGTTMSQALEQVFAVLNKNILNTVAGSVKDIGKQAEKAMRGTVDKKVGGAVDKLKGIFGK